MSYNVIFYQLGLQTAVGCSPVNTFRVRITKIAASVKIQSVSTVMWHGDFNSPSGSAVLWPACSMQCSFLSPSVVLVKLWDSGISESMKRSRVEKQRLSFSTISTLAYVSDWISCALIWRVVSVQLTGLQTTSSGEYVVRSDLWGLVQSSLLI